MAGEELIIDLSNYKDRMGSRVAPGRYRVQVEDVESGESAQKKTPQVQVWLRVLGGEFDGQTIVDRLYLTESSMFRMVNFMTAVGLPTPKARVKVNLQQFRGRVIDIDVEDGEPYNGRVRSEVRAYYKVAKAESADVEDLEGLSEFASASEGVLDVPEEEAPAPAASSQTEVNPNPTEPPAKTEVPTSAPADGDDEGAVNLDDLEV